VIYGNSESQRWQKGERHIDQDVEEGGSVDKKAGREPWSIGIRLRQDAGQFGGKKVK
jgi:hypothetical protein